MTDKEINDPNYKLLIGANTVPGSKKIDDFVNIGELLHSDSFQGGLIFSRLNSTNHPHLLNLKFPKEFLEYIETLPLMKKSWNDRDLMWINLPMQFDLEFKLVAYLKYFLNNSTSNWMIRLCDDTYINKYKIPDLLRYLNSRYDPLRDFYVGGACLDYIKEPILQGGSGLIMSKYAAKIIFSNSMDWLRRTNYYDDWEFARQLPKMGFPICNGTNPFFIGHSASTFSKWISKLGLTNLFPNCPGSLPELEYCQRVMPRMKDTAFFHDQHKVFSTSEMYHFLNYIPDNLYWYQNGESASLCFKKT